MPTDCCDWEYCPECRKEVYASLGVCPHCGRDCTEEEERQYWDYLAERSEWADDR